MRRTMIVSVFPGCGRDRLFKGLNNRAITVKNVNGMLTDIRCKNIKLACYVGDIDKAWDEIYEACQQAVGEYDFIFIDYHEELFSRLKRNSIPFGIMVPDVFACGNEVEYSELKHAWVNRVLKSDVTLNPDYDFWTKNISDEIDLLHGGADIMKSGAVTLSVLNKLEYLGDRLGLMYSEKELSRKMVANRYFKKKK